MTRQELSQLQWLKKEIVQIEYQLVAAKSKAHRISSGFSDEAYLSGYTETCAVEVARLRECLEKRQGEAVRELCRLQEYISSIPDSLTRMVFVYRYVDGLSW